MQYAVFVEEYAVDSVWRSMYSVCVVYVVHSVEEYSVCSVWSMQYAVCVQEECGGLTTGSGSRLPPQLYLLLAQLLGHLNILSFFPRQSYI